jgi:hypothetical protein
MLSTTNLMIVRQDACGDIDPYEPVEVEEKRIPIPGHISAPSGNDVAVGGLKEVVSAVAYLPSSVVLEPGDQLYEPNSGETYSIVWSRHRRGLGLDHLHVGLQVVKGGANG